VADDLESPNQLFEGVVPTPAPGEAHASDAGHRTLIGWLLAVIAAKRAAMTDAD